MRIRGVGRLRRVARWVRNGLAPGPLILMYHRIAELPLDPHRLAVTPRHFADHLEILRARNRPIPLRRLIGAIGEGAPLPRAVVVTCDDGYADNLSNGKPLLERHDVPATVFVSSGQVGSEREFWWDELERLLLQPGTLPPTLRLRVNGRIHEWGLGDAARYGADAWRRHRGWHVGQPHDPGPRQRLFRSLYRLLHALPPCARRDVLDDILTWAGASTTGRLTHRAVSADNVRDLARGGLIEVGAHTVSHPSLAPLSVGAQDEEIRRGKMDLEQILGLPVLSFAYPHGSYTAETATLVGGAGFTSACTSAPGIVWHDADPFQLPRVEVGDWDGDEFARRLGAWFH